MQYLTDARIREIWTAAIDLSFWQESTQEALVAQLSPAFRSDLPDVPIKRDQLLLWLSAINAVDRLEDGKVPLQVWLDNAVLLAGDRLQKRIFEGARDDLQKLLGLPSPGAASPLIQDPGGPVELPLSALCLLHASFAPGGSPRRLDWYTTGFLIGPRAVLTAAHAMIAPDGHNLAEYVDVAPGLDGGAGPPAWRRSTALHASQKWLTAAQKDFNDDYGLVLLGEDVPAAARFELTVADDALLTGTTCLLAGYPQTSDDGTRQRLARGPIVSVTENELVYDMAASPGQSGAPIWIEVGQRRFAVGIHTRRLGDGTKAGTRLTRDIVAEIRAWMQ